LSPHGRSYETNHHGRKEGKTGVRKRRPGTARSSFENSPQPGHRGPSASSSAILAPRPAIDALPAKCQAATDDINGWGSHPEIVRSLFSVDDSRLRSVLIVYFLLLLFLFSDYSTR
jgi:hypothetical protein